MVELVRQNAMRKKRALRVAEHIHESNPYHIKEHVLAAFLRSLGED